MGVLCFDVVVCLAVSLCVMLVLVLGCVLCVVVMCAFLLVLHRKRSRVYVQNVPVCTLKTFPCHKGHGRFERTHESVFIVHTGTSLLASLSSRVSLSLLIVSLSFLLFSLTNNDNDHSSSRLSLYAQL